MLLCASIVRMVAAAPPTPAPPPLASDPAPSAPVGTQAPVAPAAIDDESPVRPAPVALGGQDGRMVKHPGNGFGFGTGFGFGLGNDKLTIQSGSGDTANMRPGDGFVVHVQGVITPIWAGDSVGFGIGAELGIKYRSIDASDASLSFSRYPAIAFAQMVAPTGERGCFLLRAGVESDLGSSLGLSAGLGSASADLTSHAGFVAEIGAWYAMTPGAALIATGRFTRIHYTLPDGQDLDGSSFGPMLGVQFGSR